VNTFIRKSLSGGETGIDSTFKRRRAAQGVHRAPSILKEILLPANTSLFASFDLKRCVTRWILRGKRPYGPKSEYL